MKKTKPRFTGIQLASIVFILCIVGDFASTLAVGKPLIELLETNPIFHWLGLWGLLVLNFGVAALFYYGYQYVEKVNIRYAILLTMCIIVFLRFFIIINNLSVAAHPPTIEQAKSISSAVKTSYVLSSVVWPFILAYIPSVMAFGLFWKDHKIRRVKNG